MDVYGYAGGAYGSRRVGAGSAAVIGTDAKTDEVLLPGAVYDVATIKPSDPNAMGGGVGMDPNGGFYTKNQSLKNAVCNAYEVMGFQCLGGPAWLESDKYDIEAKPDGATTEQLLKLSWKQRWPVQQRMQQALLADRLKLKYIQNQGDAHLRAGGREGRPEDA